MRQIKVNDVTNVLALQVRVLEREGAMCLVQVTEPYQNQKWLDIGRIGHSGDYDTETLSLLGANVHIEGINPAGIATRLPEAEVRAKFDKLRADIIGQREAKEKAAAKAAEREKAAQLKTAKLADAGRIQREARAELRQLINSGSNVDKLADDKKIHKLLMRIAAAELIVQTLNSK